MIISDMIQTCFSELYNNSMTLRYTSFGQIRVRNGFRLPNKWIINEFALILKFKGNDLLMWF